MAKKSWASYPEDYRAREMNLLTNWIAAGESGSVVGLAGCGRSHLLSFLCHRPDVLKKYLLAKTAPVVPVLVDLNNLPTNDISTLYRTILRAFFQNREYFAPELEEAIAESYLDNRGAQDPFLSQSAFHDLLARFYDEQVRIVLVLNRFDRFCQTATPQMLNTLRGLRDSFRETLSYIVGMRQEVAYLPDPTSLGDMYDILDSHVCWVGAMDPPDAVKMVERVVQASPNKPPADDVEALLALSGRFPALLKAIIHWWLTTGDKPPTEAWAELLLSQESLHYRLDRIWAGLTQEEQVILAEIQKVQISAASETQRRKRFKSLIAHNLDVLHQLEAKGLCEAHGSGWSIIGLLFRDYVATASGRSRGRMWLEAETGAIYQGQVPVQGLTALQKDVLSFLVSNPRVQHTKTDIIVNTWPDELRERGVADDSLYQVMVTLRRKIEPNPAKPRYLITWRGRPEGGYQFFPEGKPE